MIGRLCIIYQFFYPDDVVSSRHFSDLAEGLARRGWDVTALTSNRKCREHGVRIPLAQEAWNGITIRRFSRPAFRQSSNLGRMLNSFWLMAKWLAFLAKEESYDAIILGTDPQFAYLMFPAIRRLKPRTKLIYWGFDLYPEAIVADGNRVLSAIARAIRPITKRCYARVDGMVDIGPCMRARLGKYGHRAECATLVPWAITEPKAPLACDQKTRQELFGDAKLTLLYSGTIGKAHEFKCFIELARELRRRRAPVALCFAGRGNMYDELVASTGHDDINISFADFAYEDQLEKRLSSGDIHLLSLRSGWEGIVVPSKFFGSLAAGRPLLFEGTPNSSIKTWIEKYNVGYVLEENNIGHVADMLCEIVEDPKALRGMQQASFDCYQMEFSRERVIDGWHSFISMLLKPRQVAGDR